MVLCSLWFWSNAKFMMPCMWVANIGCNHVKKLYMHWLQPRGRDTWRDRPGSSFCWLSQIKFSLKQLQKRGGGGAARQTWRTIHSLQRIALLLNVNQRKQASCSLICSYCGTGMRSQSEISMQITALTVVMDEHSNVCLSSGAEARAEAQPSATRNTRSMEKTGVRVHAARFNGILCGFIYVSM